MIEIPQGFARNTVAREGESGSNWIATLPGLVDDLLQRWNCTPVEPPLHGHVGIVVPVRHRDLPPAVLKVSYPHPGNVHEPDAFATWAGRGAVVLYERDDTHFAMLLERATPRTLADVDDADEAATTAGRLARRLAVPAPAQLPRLRDRVEQWATNLRQDTDHLRNPLPHRVVAAAVATLSEIGPDQPDTLVHGDLHYTNIMRGQREPWLAIDPKGYVGDPAYDTITVLGSHYKALLAADDPTSALLRCLAIFADAAEIDRDRARRWAQVRAVTAAFWGRRHNDPHWLVQANDQVAEQLA